MRWIALIVILVVAAAWVLPIITRSGKETAKQLKKTWEEEKKDDDRD